MTSQDSTVISSVSLTGATGFIGSRLLAQLSRSGMTVRALYRPRKGEIPPAMPGVTWIAGDLFDHDALQKLVQDTEAIIHCAGAVRGKNQRDFDLVNQTGTHNIAMAAIRNQPFPRLLLVSSLAAREPGLSHYAKSKRGGEQIVQSLSEQLRWAIIRPPAVFGPGDKELLPLFQSIRKGFIPIPGNGNGRFSMIHVDDLTTAIVSLLKIHHVEGQIFEIDDGQDNGYDWDKVIETARKVFNQQATVRKIMIPGSLLNTFAWLNVGCAHLLGYRPMLTPGKVRELTHPDWVSHHTEAFSRLSGWRPRYTLEQGLQTIHL